MFGYLLDLSFGILHQGQFLYLFILSINPGLIRLFNLKQFLFLLVGVGFSIFNHRAILPFMLLAILDLQTPLTKDIKQMMLLFFFIASGILLFFGRGYA